MKFSPMAILKPRGAERIIYMRSISGPGNLVVFYTTAGDYRVSNTGKILWDQSCAGSED
jgi:hypothetical protein